jgi:hypothetical protein
MRGYVAYCAMCGEIHSDYIDEDGLCTECGTAVVPLINNREWEDQE